MSAKVYETASGELTASEALYAFCGWLTTREEPTVMSFTDEAAPAVERITEFVERHGLPWPRDGWERLIVPDPRVVEAVKRWQDT